MTERRNLHILVFSVTLILGAGLAGCAADESPSDQTGSNGDSPSGGDQSGDPSPEEAQDPPSASFSHDCSDLSCTFDGGSSQAGDAQISTYQWEFGDGATGSGGTVERTYESGGSYTVTLTVTDADGNSDSSEQEIHVNAPEAPSAAFTADCEDLTCSFDAASTQAGEAEITSYEWSFGDGGTSSGETTERTYEEGREYMVTLTVTDANGQTDEASQSVQVTAPPPEPLEFSGSGDHATEIFTTQQKLLRVDLSHTGESNFAVWLKTDQGEDEELMANKIGTYEGSRFFIPPAGDYLLDIDADGSWNVVIEQPRYQTGETPPFNLGETGDTASSPLQLEEGLARFEMTHDGDSNFAIWLYSAEGQRIALLANEIGQYEGSTTENIPQDGIYVMDIVADGSWTIEVTT